MEPAPIPQGGQERLKVLDGWRAVSILSVMAAHMLPIGPKAWLGNDMLATFGMAIFFTLSGFLIVSILWRDQHVGRFLKRRLSRIVPLAWLTLAIVFVVKGTTLAEAAANFLFYANLPPFYLSKAGHFWSLGVEAQFYVVIALIVALAGRNGLWMVPLGALAVTALRIWTGTEVSIVTWLRLDEILSGGCLALIHAGAFGARPKAWLAHYPLWISVPLALAASHDFSGWFNYPRPYLTSAMVGSLLYRGGAVRTVLESRPATYVARISYALYIVHMFTMQGWFGEGGKVVVYLKRLLSIALSFFLAHLSTSYFEAFFIRWSHGRSPAAGASRKQSPSGG